MNPIASIMTITIGVGFMAFVVFTTQVVRRRRMIVRRILIAVFFRRERQHVLYDLRQVSLLILTYPNGLNKEGTRIRRRRAMCNTRRLHLILLRHELFNPLYNTITRLRAVLARFFNGRPYRTQYVLATIHLKRRLFKCRTVFESGINRPNGHTTVARQVTRRPFRRFIVRQLFTNVSGTLRRGVNLLRLVPRRIMILQGLGEPRSVPNCYFNARRIRPNRRPTATQQLLVYGSF